MPFTARLDGYLVTPVDVTKSDATTCPGCELEVTVVEAHKRDGTFVSRHFSHVSESCSYESSVHIMMKAIVASYFKKKRPQAEVHVDSKRIGDRLPDVLVVFPDTDHELGNGVCVECQYRNIGKDCEAVQAEYLEHGYSTLWLSQRSFDTMTVDVSTGKWHRFGDEWPRLVEHKEIDTPWPVDPGDTSSHRAKIPGPVIRKAAAKGWYCGQDGWFMCRRCDKLTHGRAAGMCRDCYESTKWMVVQEALGFDPPQCEICDAEDANYYTPDAEMCKKCYDDSIEDCYISGLDMWSDFDDVPQKRY